MHAIFPLLGNTLKQPYNRGVSFLVGRLVLIVFPFSITKSPISISVSEFVYSSFGIVVSVFG